MKLWQELLCCVLLGVWFALVVVLVMVKLWFHWEIVRSVF
jgi:hypothetical protein